MPTEELEQQSLCCQDWKQTSESDNKDPTKQQENLEKEQSEQANKGPDQDQAQDQGHDQDQGEEVVSPNEEKLDEKVLANQGDEKPEVGYDSFHKEADPEPSGKESADEDWNRETDDDEDKPDKDKKSDQIDVPKDEDKQERKSGRKRSLPEDEGQEEDETSPDDKRVKMTGPVLSSGPINEISSSLSSSSSSSAKRVRVREEIEEKNKAKRSREETDGDNKRAKKEKEANIEEIWLSDDEDDDKADDKSSEGSDVVCLDDEEEEETEGSAQVPEHIRLPPMLEIASPQQSPSRILAAQESGDMASTESAVVDSKKDSSPVAEKKVINDLGAVIADRRKAEERASSLLEAFDDQGQEYSEEG